MFLYPYPQFSPQSVDFIIFFLQLLLKLNTPSILLYLQQHTIVGYSSIFDVLVVHEFVLVVLFHLNTLKTFFELYL